MPRWLSREWSDRCFAASASRVPITSWRFTFSGLKGDAFRREVSGPSSPAPASACTCTCPRGRARPVRSFRGRPQYHSGGTCSVAGLSRSLANKGGGKLLLQIGLN